MTIIENDLNQTTFIYVVICLLQLQLALSIKQKQMIFENNRGTQREYSSKPIKHNIVKRILVFKR